MDPVVKHWREDTPGCANQIHFNNAGSGLMPRAVLEAITAHLNREANLGGYESADDAEVAVEDAYAAVAKVLGAQPRNIAVVENSTVAFFQALSAFDFKAGDVIVTTRNDYISNQLAYLSLARRYGVEVRRAADMVSGGADPQSVKELLRDPRVRLAKLRKRQVCPIGWMSARPWGRFRWMWRRCVAISFRARRESSCAVRGESDSCTSRTGP